jgi:hypothetical protein
MDGCSMKLGKTYDQEDYDKAITVVGLHHEEREREIEHQKKLKVAWSKSDTHRGKDSSKPEFSNHKGYRQNPYDKGKKKTQFSDTSKSIDKD